MPRPAIITPLLLGWAVHGLDPRYFDARPWLAPAIVAAPYLLAGYLRCRPAFALVGAAALGVAAVQRWEAVPQVWALLALGVLWAALDLGLGRSDGRWYGLVSFAVPYLGLVPSGELDLTDQLVPADALRPCSYGSYRK